MNQISSSRVTGPRHTAAVAAECRAVGKVYGGEIALEDVDLRILEGEVHALVGENGAGKSTLLGTLSGRTVPSSGTVEVFGHGLEPGNPRAARRAGVAAIYQELTIVPRLSAVANVYLGQVPRRGVFLDEKRMRQEFRELCASLDVQIDPTAIAGTLPLASQQMIEIMRAVAADARILLFDEPTAALGENERESLWALIRRLRSLGRTVVFVSHNLDEVLDLCDRLTVLRDGIKVAEGERGEWTKDSLVRAMVGRDIEVAARRSQQNPGDVLLRAEGVTVPGAIDGIDVEIREGEILGLGGLVGSGRSTLLRSLAGLEHTSTGRMWLKGGEVDWPRSVRQALAYGIAMLPEDRKNGLVLGRSSAQNVILGGFGPATTLGLVSAGKERSIAAEHARGVGFRDRVTKTPGELSGGNQQKILLAKWLFRRPMILLADEPTRGIDIGAKTEVLQTLDGLAMQGWGIVVASSELEEVVALADKILVLSAGRAVGTLDQREGSVTTEDVLLLSFRVEAV